MRTRGKYTRLAKHFFQRQYRTANGDWSSVYYARFVCRFKKKHRTIPLGADQQTAKDKLKRIEAQDVDRYDFDLGNKRLETRTRYGKTEPLTFAEWSERYPKFDDIEQKVSLGTDLTLIRLHLKPFFGAMLITEIPRDTLHSYIEYRAAQSLIRNKKGQSKKFVQRGTISNELSLLRRMLRVAGREGFKVIVPSFEGLIKRTERGGRALTDDEQKKVLAVYDRWMQRVAEFANETCLSEGDLLRLTDQMIDHSRGVIVPACGRKKTGVEQVAPLTLKARSILDEIKAERRNGIAISNVNGLVFTNPDGTPITKGQIQYQVERALKLTGIKKFVFHNYRNTALTRWARDGINVDIAMKASGHLSVQMHKRYVDLQKDDVAAAFGTADSQIATDIATENRVPLLNS